MRDIDNNKFLILSLFGHKFIYCSWLEHNVCVSNICTIDNTT
jgi:hypothetical protein